jgi:hypothetical protein
MWTGIKSKIVTALFASLALLLSLALSPAKSAEEPSLLYATAEFGTKLVAFSLEAKTVRVIGDTGFPFSLALGFCPPGGVPYTITSTFAPAAQLAILNLSTGAATRIGSPLGQPLSLMGMTCSPDGTLYAIGQFDSTNPTTFNSLYRVSRETGLATRIGSTGVLDLSDPSGFSGFLMALAFAPDGTLYGANSASTLFRVSTSTGEATKVVDLVNSASASPLVGVMGLAIDSDGNFYVSDFVKQSSIYKINVATGAATPILNAGLGFVHNIAFKTPG